MSRNKEISIKFPHFYPPCGALLVCPRMCRGASRQAYGRQSVVCLELLEVALAYEQAVPEPELVAMLATKTEMRENGVTASSSLFYNRAPQGG